MWERIKMWLGRHHSSQLSRLDAAVAANLDAQRKLQVAGDEAADAAVAARRHAILARWRARSAARRLREQPLRTSEVRSAIEGVLARPGIGGVSRSEGKP